MIQAKSKKQTSTMQKAIEGMLVELSGTFQSGMMAIGGETTGTTLTTQKGEIYELLFKGETPLSPQIQSGARVRVRGTLSQVTGVEIARRNIVRVTEISVLP